MKGNDGATRFLLLAATAAGVTPPRTQAAKERGHRNAKSQFAFQCLRPLGDSEQQTAFIGFAEHAFYESVLTDERC
jgi:hypothetical protein